MLCIAPIPLAVCLDASFVGEYQRAWQHQRCKVQCRHLEVAGCGSASSLVSGISALQNLEYLEIEVGNSLGSIGKLRALTELLTRFTRQGTREELHLENPKLQFLSVMGFGKNDTPVKACYDTLHLSTSPSLHLPALS